MVMPDVGHSGTCPTKPSSAGGEPRHPYSSKSTSAPMSSKNSMTSRRRRQPSSWCWPGSQRARRRSSGRPQALRGPHDLADNLANRRAVRRKPRHDLVYLLVHGETALVASNLSDVFHWPWRARGTAPANAHTVRWQTDEPLHLIGGNASAVNREAGVLLDPHRPSSVSEQWTGEAHRRRQEPRAPPEQGTWA